MLKKKNKIYYVTNKNPVFHQVAYASITIGVVVRGALVTKYELEPALKKRSPLQADKIMKQMWTLMTLGKSKILLSYYMTNDRPPVSIILC